MSTVKLIYKKALPGFLKRSRKNLDQTNYIQNKHG